MAKRLAWVATVLAFLLAPAALNAETIFVTFEGTVTKEQQPPGSMFALGDAISGSFQFESDAVDADPNPQLGTYATAGGTIQVGSYVTDVAADLDIFNGAFDAFTWEAPISGPTVDGIFASYVQLQLVDLTAAVFSDDSLPTSLSLAPFTFQREFFVDFRTEDGSADGSPYGSLTARVTTFTVPEPAAGLLLIPGLLGLGAARRRGSPLD